MKIKFFVASLVFVTIFTSNGSLIFPAYGESMNKTELNHNFSKAVQQKEESKEDNFSFGSGTCGDVEGLSVDNKQSNSTKTDSTGCE